MVKQLQKREKTDFKVKHMCSVLALSLALGACASSANVESAVQSAPNASLTDLAWGAANRGDHFAAIPMFRRAHRSSSGAAEPLYGLGKSLMAVGQYADAVQVLQMAIGNEAGHGPSQQALGQALLIMGDYAGAVQAMEMAVQAQGGRASTVAALGVALDANGQHDAALANFRQAYSMDPGNLDVTSNLGLSLALHGESAEAIELLEDVVRDGRSTAKHRQNLSLVYALDGQLKKAVAMASIDLDYRSVEANIAFVDMVRAMPAQQRMAAMVSAGANSKRTNDGHAYRGPGEEDENTRATVDRLLPNQQASVEPIQTVVEEVEADPVGLGGVPPLLEPSGWAVQIAAYRKIEHLAPGWDYLSTKYAHIIGGLEPRRSEVDHPQSDRGPVGFFYRLNAGPLTGREQAVSICQKMQAEGGECWVRPPEPAEGTLPQDPAAEQDFISSRDHDAVMNQAALDVINQKELEAVPVMAEVAPPQWEPHIFEPPIEVAMPATVEAQDVIEEPEAVAAAPWAPHIFEVPTEVAMPEPIEAPETVEVRQSVAEIDPPVALHVESQNVASVIETPEALNVDARQQVAEVSPVTSTFVAVVDEDAPVIVFGGDVEDAPSLVDSLAEDEGAVEVLPANFGTNGIINLSDPDKKPLIDVINAFEEAETSLFEEAVTDFPSEIDEEGQP